MCNLYTFCIPYYRHLFCSKLFFSLLLTIKSMEKNARALHILVYIYTMAIMFMWNFLCDQRIFLFCCFWMPNIQYNTQHKTQTQCVKMDVCVFTSLFIIICRHIAIKNGMDYELKFMRTQKHSQNSARKCICLDLVVYTLHII